MSEPALAIHDLWRSFPQADGPLEVLRGVSLALAPGEIVALLGPSGAGKSTLLHMAGLLERPDQGEITIGGEPCSGLSDARRTMLRRSHVGFVYQFHHLLPEFTALENVVLPQMVAGHSRFEARARARHLLTKVGLASRLDHRPAKLSGGEQQRVAIARALANEPRVLLADEPTGNLDQKTADVIFDVLLDLVRTAGVAALIATHNTELAARMDRMLVLDRGRIRDA